MEIRNDLSSRITVSPVQTRPQNEIQSTQKFQESQQAGGLHTSTLREMANAMTIMQTANGIVQEALNVSSKLRSIAMTTMSTGTVSTDDLAQALTGIRSTIQQNGGQPLPSPAVQQSTGVSRTNENPVIAGVERDVNRLIKVAGAEKPDQQELSSIEKSLTRRRDEIASEIESYGRTINPSFSYGKSIASKEEYSSMIKENPPQAILSQGNIRPDIVSSLI